MIVFDGSQYRTQDTTTPLPPGGTFTERDYTQAYRLRRHDCDFGDSSFDHWKDCTLEDGVDPDLAELGRSLIREAISTAGRASCKKNAAGPPRAPATP